MRVTVRDGTASVAVAGQDLTADQGANIMLNGSASSDNVGIVNWTWTVGTGTARGKRGSRLTT